MQDTLATRKALWLVASFGVCFLAGASLCWRSSYEEYLQGNRWSGGALLLLLGAVALLLTRFIGSTTKSTGIAIASVFPAVIVGRVILDCVKDPTNHNLWPFEIGIAIIISALVVFPCAAIGLFLRHITHRAQGTED